jgi:hypothetical protein
MLKVTENWLHEVTGKHRDTIKRHTAHLKRDDAGKMRSDHALQALYIGEDGQLTHSEALRRLAVAREKQIAQDIRLKEERHVTIEEHTLSLIDLNAVWRAALINHCLNGERLTQQKVNNIIDSAFDLCTRGLPPEEQRRARRERALSFVDEVQRHLEYLKNERARLDWRTGVQAAQERLRDAYQRTAKDKSPAAIAALKEARADLQKISLALAPNTR